MLLVEELLSLPAEGAVPRPLSAPWDPRQKTRWLCSVKESVLPKEICAQRLSASDVPMSWLDPKRRPSWKAYNRFVLRLVNCGVLYFGVRQLCDVGIFAVAKKSGKQRSVVDAR